ncbi:MAG TPA: RNA 2',3'-cyclic phosphodiesterase [Bacillota bacterium]|nr:RNA 2',3'-cyclic phosphodiesterase [Candidatus Fermentithermobacillaceae bacterium]HOB29953.1 RNA 2',3'-cyclic phosphodiesterase [Bacillota bacterium]HOK63823.1 RNA 2',3'-cyclic phosphodiesterase [Bacillota bacterium]HOL11489.1 RNA 2',3'-cyclic phosphodiesterase [Bacillota bacterium]HOQ03219.1 RNA 2',3'-cyclic phosphodiesterase [Bacillota bacterium]
MDEATLRAFIAIDIPQHIKTFLESFVVEAQKHIYNCRFVNIDNMHLTLKFLGNDVKESLIPDISLAIEEVAKSTEPFDICLGDIGTFPIKGRPRVFYVGLSQGEEQVTNLAINLQSALQSLGFEKDDSFQPHLTLARRKNKSPSEQQRIDERGIWRKLFADYKAKVGNEVPLCWQVNEVLLIKSELFREGPIYSVLTTHQLNPDNCVK